MNVFHFLRPREKLLLLEVLPERMGAMFLSVDRDRVVAVLKTRRNIGPKELAAYLKVHRAKQNIIVAADPSLVSTVHLPVHIDRANHAEELSAIELENLLSKAIAQSFNAYRSDASRELGVDGLDTMLVGSRVMRFTIDGHEVLNPVGFAVKQIDAQLELTLTTRAIFERLRTLLASRRTFFLTETGRSAVSAVARAVPTSANFITLGAEHSNGFATVKSEDGAHVARMPFFWRTSVFEDILSTAFGTGGKGARDMYASFLMGETSPAAAKYLEKLIRPAIVSLVAELKLAGLKGRVYIETDTPLPVPLPYENGVLTLVEPPLAEVLDTVGVTIRPTEWGRTDGEVLRRLAPFLEFYFQRGNSQVDEWLKRHLSWLGAPQ